MKRRLGISMLLVGLLLLTVAASASAQALGPIHRFSAEFQFSPPDTLEHSTTATPAAGGAGGITTYSKTLFIPFRTLFVTISATGDTHGGAALLMTCVVDGVVCQPGGGLGTAGPSGWITLQKLPVPTATTNCNAIGSGDGGGGPGDCHDNNINYTWCTTVDGPGVRTVELKLASSSGGEVFYERAHIYIDGTPNKNAEDGCVQAAQGPFTGLLP